MHLNTFMLREQRFCSNKQLGWADLNISNLIRIISNSKSKQFLQRAIIRRWRIITKTSSSATNFKRTNKWTCAWDLLSKLSCEIRRLCKQPIPSLESNCNFHCSFGRHCKKMGFELRISDSRYCQSFSASQRCILLLHWRINISSIRGLGQFG